MNGVLGWQLALIDNISAKTTIRLWHELHCVKRIPHDFQNMIAPTIRDNEFYMSMIKYNEIRAIAQCEMKDDTILLCAIAHPPEYLDGALTLLHNTHDLPIGIKWEDLRFQTKWFCEALLTTHEFNSVEKKYH